MASSRLPTSPYRERSREQGAERQQSQQLPCCPAAEHPNHWQSNHPVESPGPVCLFVKDLGNATISIEPSFDACPFHPPMPWNAPCNGLGSSTCGGGSVCAGGAGRGAWAGEEGVNTDSTDLIKQHPKRERAHGTPPQICKERRLVYIYIYPFPHSVCLPCHPLALSPPPPSPTTDDHGPHRSFRCRSRRRTASTPKPLPHAGKPCEVRVA